MCPTSIPTCSPAMIIQILLSKGIILDTLRGLPYRTIRVIFSSRWQYKGSDALFLRWAQVSSFSRCHIYFWRSLSRNKKSHVKVYEKLLFTCLDFLFDVQRWISSATHLNDRKVRCKCRVQLLSLRHSGFYFSQQIIRHRRATHDQRTRARCTHRARVSPNIHHFTLQNIILIWRCGPRGNDNSQHVKNEALALTVWKSSCCSKTQTCSMQQIFWDRSAFTVCCNCLDTLIHNYVWFRDKATQTYAIFLLSIGTTLSINFARSLCEPYMSVGYSRSQEVTGQQITDQFVCPS